VVVLAAVAVFLFFFLSCGGEVGGGGVSVLTEGTLVVVWAAAMAGMGVWLVRVFSSGGSSWHCDLAGLGIGFSS